MWRDKLLKPLGKFMERDAWQEFWAFIEGLNHGNQSGKHRNKSSELNFLILLLYFFFLLSNSNQTLEFIGNFDSVYMGQLTMAESWMKNGKEWF